MPLSPISLLVGGTLAAIGSAYVFKKFVYDPHLAPFIEALLADHDPRYRDRPEAYYHNHPHDSRRHRQPVPIPVSVATGHSSSRHRGCQPGAVLRRRSARRDSNDFERDRVLLKGSDRDIELDEQVVAVGQHRPSIDTLPVYREAEADDAWGRHSAYELKESIMSVRPVATSDNIPVAGPSVLGLGASASSARPVFDADTPEVGDSAYLRPAPARLGGGEMDDLLGPVGHGVEQHEYAQASTAFSILSLSQISSPESPTAALASMQQQQPRSPYRRSPLAEPNGLEMSGVLLPTMGTSLAGSGGARDADDRDDIISLADTDAGVHSLPSRATSPPPLPASPARAFTPFSPVRSGAASPFSDMAASRLSDSLAVSELGLSWAPVSAPATSIDRSISAAASDLRRAPMSVVSLSESEGWSAGSEWDGLTDEHHTI